LSWLSRGGWLLQVDCDDNLTLNMLEASAHNKEVSRGDGELSSVDLTLTMFLACTDEGSHVAANLSFNMSLPTLDDTQESRKQEPQSHKWLAAYGRLTVCSYPMQSRTHNMLASNSQSIMNVPSSGFPTKVWLILKAANTPLIAQGQLESDA
jgi:hypothetical protein